MHSFLIRIVATAPPLISVVALFLVSITFTACGSKSEQAAAMLPPVAQPPVALAPAIPAAEPVLLYNGTGTSADVSAVEAVLDTLSIGYETADSTQLNAMTEPQLAGYKLLIIPGGNSITIGENLTAQATSIIRGAVQQYGVHYLGLCAGAFFGGYSTYNGVDLTAGVSFDFYADEYKGIHVEAVEISFPTGAPLDVYWQDGPELSGWGDVVAKFPDGTPAIVEGQSGNGFVLLTGIHPEAPESWRESMNFTTPVSVDVTYAGTIIESALTGTPLPHF